MIKNNVIHIRSLKQVLNHGLIFKIVHRVIRFDQKDWLTLIWVGKGLFPHSWFSLNNIKIVKAVTLEFCSIQ